MTTDHPTERPTRGPRRRHGLGGDGIDAIRDRQDGKCAICRRPEVDEPGSRLAVDHDHAHCSGKIGCAECVRGLLCVHCNNLLRTCRDDHRILQAAIEYLAGPREPQSSIEDMPVVELLRRLRPADEDPRLMPRQGRRDRFFMMLLEAPAAAATVAEAGWMLDQDPQGYRDAIRRADEFYGGPGALETKLASVLPQDLDDAAGRAFLRRVAEERAKLGMSSPAKRRDQMTLGDVNAYLRSRSRKGTGPSTRID